MKAKPKNIPTQAQKLAQVLEPRLQELGWAQAQFESETGSAISQQRISNWLGRKARVPSRDDCAALAATVLVGLMKKGKTVPPSAFGIFHDVLNAAGYAVHDDFDEQQCWARISRDGGIANKTLRVGWFRWGNFAYSKREDAAIDDPLDFQGPSREICQRICELLGLRISPIRLTVPQIGAKIQNREVDVLAPFIQLPARLFEISCSNPLPIPSSKLAVGINIVVHEKHIPGLTGLGESSRSQRNGRAPNSNASGEDARGWFDDLLSVPFRKLRCRCAKDSVPDVILPAAIDDLHWEPEESLSDAWEKTRNDPGGTLVPACVADEISCSWFEDTNPTYKRLLKSPPYRLPVSLGVHPSETKLLSTLNACLDILERDGFLQAHIQPDRLGRGLAGEIGPNDTGFPRSDVPQSRLVKPPARLRR